MLTSLLTYHRRSEGVTWRFRCVLSQDLRERCERPSERAEWLAEQVPGLLTLLEDFAYPSWIHAETRSGQEYDQVRPITEAKLRRLGAFLRRATDVRLVTISSVLLCQEVIKGELEPLELDYGGHLRLYIDLESSGALTARADAVRLDFELCSDIYAPITADLKKGVYQDNSELAALNGPRLTAFMRRLQTTLPLELSGFDPAGLWERGLVDRFGFKLPDERREPSASEAVSAAARGGMR
jgi:hypothetical protein